MAREFPPIGNKVVAKILSAEGDCTIGMKPGEEYELSVHQCGDFCGLFYHHLLNWITLLQFDGTFPMGPDKDTMIWECPNFNNRVKVELKRIKK